MTRIGIVGTGNISGIYLQNAPRFGLEVLAVADLDLARAQAQALSHGVPQALSVDELLAHQGIEIVLNLTVPAAHGPVTRRVLEAGLIGEAVHASAHMSHTGPDAWHPDPHFFFQPGAGPLLDMGRTTSRRSPRLPPRNPH